MTSGVARLRLLNGLLRLELTFELCDSCLEFLLLPASRGF